ncbi:MAG TPA: methylenetetrahydrofolate--tRNA-(uracil(54)-C(5))-methyltransferase (FADH(2)-oxidizing) TrmFO [Thermotogota bacterium]|nr:methylenetetrahydrofolate--tRNA-(uracil(54)-C(5))-methyltransferase (FADH(2)-oxidizing) TrmFO [Thermotogota bacterium]HRW91810.1 methylenetetrahydrofolate--tRNA-(uracil(54)-C(5))-methyltransferase (FADH(2)-oxidizing) TrmFO [Thermotogota bacterium]
MKTVQIIGGGFAGTEAALFLASRGYEVVLFEMRPGTSTPVHLTADLAEPVCSNSFKSLELENASGLLKEELLLMGSSLVPLAMEQRVPAGKALAVDRQAFSRAATQLAEQRGVRIRREEVTSLLPFLQGEAPVLVCTGPLTTDGLLQEFGALWNTENAHFFDAIAPIVEAQSINRSRSFWMDRYGTPGEGDYLNCPLTEPEYRSFWEEVVEAPVAPVEAFDRKDLFERCQPFEEIARSGFDALRFGPMKPVGLVDPATGKQPYAVVQLRQDNHQKNFFSPVGFQTRLKWGAQKKVLQMIPALEEVNIVRYGVMHKNVYLESARILDAFFRVQPCLLPPQAPPVFFAGQITGLEGYVESMAGGLYVARNLDRFFRGLPLERFPEDTMCGALFSYVSSTLPLKPMYANFGLLPDISGKKRERRRKKAIRALDSVRRFLQQEEENVDAL